MRPDEIKKQGKEKDVEIISSPFSHTTGPEQTEQDQESPDLLVHAKNFDVEKLSAPAETQEGRFAPSVWVKMGGYIINLEKVKYVVVGKNRISIFLSQDTAIEFAIGYTSPYPPGLVSEKTFGKIKNFFETLIDTEIG